MAKPDRKLIFMYLLISAVAALALAALHLTDTVPEGVDQLEQRPLVYYGPEAVTRHVSGASPDALQRAETALADTAYHGAYAEGPFNGRGVWTGAHSIDTARRYALAACGTDCAVVAERVPLHAEDPEAPDVLVTLPGLAQRVSDQWPFLSRGDMLAVGGAGAWGTGHAGSRDRGSHTAIRRALAECESRRATENTPAGIASPPCRYMSLGDLDIDHRAPESPLFPAVFEISLTTLVPVPDSATRLVGPDGSRVWSVWRPRELHGARAGNGDGPSIVIRRAGWPEAATELALARCEAARRFGTPPCALRSIRVPDDPLPPGALAVPPDLHEAYLWWQNTAGAGAFAIGPLGTWEMSYGFATLEDARQRVADGCAQRSRRGSSAYILRRALVDLPACRIVAERAN